MRSYPYAFHIALDGNGLNGLEGRAGVCLFRYDPATGDHAYKVTYFDGVAGGHATSLSPQRTVGFLGNVGQHLLFYDPRSLDEVERVSTLRFEVTDHALKGTTHLVWLDDVEFVTVIGENLWRFDVNRLSKAEPIGPHGLKLPHAMKRSASGRYVAYGGMDHPDRGEAKEIGIFDLVTGDVRRLPLPTTCWHIAAHPAQDLFYALSFRVLPQDGRNWHEWAMAYFREYVYEIDAGREVPAHVNSDVCVSDRELVFATGGSQTVVLISLKDFASYRVLDERPRLDEQFAYSRQAASTVIDAFTRASPVTSAKHYADALRVSRGTLLDGVYACQLSADQSLLFTANRGRNHITVYDYPSLALRDRIVMPELQEFDARLASWSDPRLGFHHSTLISPDRTPTPPANERNGP
jgi:hypothetical protein